MRLFSWGGETGNVNQGWTEVSGPSISTAHVRSGTYAIHFSEVSHYASRVLGVYRDELYFRIGLYPENYARACCFLSLYDRNEVPHLTFQLLEDAGTLQVRLGGSTGVVIAQSVSPIPTEAYVCLELHVVIADSTGVIEARLDGASLVDYTGDTRNGGIAEVSRVQYGKYASTSGSSFYALDSYMDDLAINDVTGDHNNTWVGRGGIWPVLVTGAGDLAQFTPSAGNNYECVDEVPPDGDTSYVSSDTEGHQDSYQIALPEGVSGGVTAVTAWHYARLAESGAGNLTPFLRKSGVNYDGDVKGLDTTFTFKSQTWETNPATGEPWTLDEIEDFYVGQETS